MSGTINTTPADGQSGLANPLLKQTEQALEARLTPQNRTDFMKVVVAGLHIALDKGPDGWMAKLAHMPDPIAGAAKGAVALILVMRKEAKGVMPMQAAIPAGLVLVLHGLDFLDRSGIVKIAENEVARATTLFTNELFHRLGITPQMLQTAAGNVHKLVQDPTQMAQLQLRAGLTRHPDAAMPADIPGLPQAA